MSTSDWVLAAPFRSHVRHLCETTGLPWQVVGAAADVGQRTMATLMRGRDGAVRPRLHARDAQRLFRLRVATLREGPVRVTTAPESRGLLLALLADGAALPHLATVLQTDEAELERLRDGRAFGVRELLLWRLRAMVDVRALEPLDTRIAA